MINPNVAIFVAALRSGKTEAQALEAYCWASRSVPIDERAHINYRDPMDCPPRLNLTSAGACGFDAFEEGGSDDEIAEAFLKGREVDRDRGVLWRAMRKDEKPSVGWLVRSLTEESRTQLSSIVGVTATAEMLISR